MMKQSQRELQRFQRDVDYFQAHQEELLSKYPDQWVAIYNQQVVGAAQDPEQLLDQLEEQGIPIEHALFEHLSTKEELWILSV